MSNKGSHKIGYKCPPPHSQFKPGESGNPSGRPKRRRNSLKTDLVDELSKTVNIQERGRVRRVAKQRAFVATVVNGAIAGDHRLARLLISLCAHAFDGEPDNELGTEPPLERTLAELEVAARKYCDGKSLAQLQEDYAAMLKLQPDEIYRFVKNRW